MDIDAPIQALRYAVADAAGLAYLDEGGNGEALRDRLPPFGAYTVEPVQFATEGHGYAIHDTVAEMTVQFVYVMERTGSESMSDLRTILALMAAAALDKATWAADLTCGIHVKGGEYGMGGADEYGAYMQENEPNMVAGHVSVNLTVVD